MSEENNKIVGGTRIPELDIMKLVGIVLVVVGHVTRRECKLNCVKLQ